MSICICPTSFEWIFWFFFWFWFLLDFLGGLCFCGGERWLAQKDASMMVGQQSIYMHIYIYNDDLHEIKRTVRIANENKSNNLSLLAIIFKLSMGLRWVRISDNSSGCKRWLVQGGKNYFRYSYLVAVVEVVVLLRLFIYRATNSRPINLSFK